MPRVVSNISFFFLSLDWREQITGSWQNGFNQRTWVQASAVLEILYVSLWMPTSSWHWEFPGRRRRRRRGVKKQNNISFNKSLSVQYLCLSSVDHQVIKLAEDALLQLIPGNRPVLPHQERRPKPKTSTEEISVTRAKKHSSNCGRPLTVCIGFMHIHKKTKKKKSKMAEWYWIKWKLCCMFKDTDSITHSCRYWNQKSRNQS